MLGNPGNPENALSVDSVANRLVKDAKRDLGSAADDRFLEQCAWEAVRDVWHDEVKVTTFVPVLAMRRMREIVSVRSVDQLGVRSDA